MGSDYQTAGGEKPLNLLKHYGQYLPQIMQVLNGQTSGTTNAQLDATNALVNGDKSLNAQTLNALNTYGVPLAEAGNAITRTNALAGAETNKQQITGAGGDAARAAGALTNELNPALAAANKGAADAVGAINLKGLSPGEAAAVERSLNQSNTQTGNLGLNNATNVVANAMNFGGAFNNKINTMNNAVTAATGAANASTNAFNPTNVALSQPSPAASVNPGMNLFTGANPATANTAMGTNTSNAGSIWSGLTGTNNAAQAAGASMANTSSPASILGSICCFIFLEAYHGKLPPYIRHGRDWYYKMNPDIATGYRRTARWLVPMMKKSTIVRFLVWKFMVGPISDYLAFANRHSRIKRGRKITHFWLRLWAILGKGKNESDYAMKWEYPVVA